MPAPEEVLMEVLEHFVNERMYKMPGSENVLADVLEHFVQFDRRHAARAVHDLLDVVDRWHCHLPGRPGHDPEVVAYVSAADALNDAIWDARRKVEEGIRRDG